MKLTTVLFSAALLAFPAVVAAHSGGTDKNGCHLNRNTGERHCHGRNGTTPARPLLSRSQGTFANCAAARAAGAAPVRRGDPGYGSHLDRDNDGIGCE